MSKIKIIIIVIIRYKIFDDENATPLDAEYTKINLCYICQIPMYINIAQQMR